MIQIVNLKKSFGGKEVLRGISLEVPDGATTVVIGPSGCGKTVLLKHIVGLMRPDEGKVIIDELEISSLYGASLFKIRECISVVFQSSALLDSLTVGNNITLGLREHTKLREPELNEIINEKLEMVKLEGTAELMPAELSGGMKKRVAIARAIATNPKYILYDEPTTGLDPVTANKIDELICALQKKLKITAIVVTHDLISAYKIGDKVAMLREGEIIFEGTPEEIRNCEEQKVKEFVRGRIYE